jgi:ribosomal protein S6--L-glutamate ligase
MVQIGVLSKNREYFPTAKLLEEMDHRRNLSGVFLSTQYVSPLVSNSISDAIFADQSLKALAGVIPRIGRSHTQIGLTYLKQFELMGIPTTLSAKALFLARDKFRCYQALKDIPNLKIPKTILISNSYMIEKVINRFKFPIVIKIPNATQGTGTILTPSRRVAHEMIDALFLRYDSPIMVQEYLRNTNSSENTLSEDIRVLVVGRSVLGAMRRIAPQGEWRTNYAQGAECVSYKTTSEEQELAMKIIDRLCIEIAGIDLFPTEDGFYVLEVNACPGWKAFESANPHISVAKKIIDYIETKIRQ